MGKPAGLITGIYSRNTLRQPADKVIGKKMLRCEKISKFYGHFCALSDLDMYIQDGALYGFVGPNGAGKTTAIKIMTGILHPDSGQVTIDGKVPGVDNALLKERIGYVPDTFGVYNDLKVREYMEFFASCSGLGGLTLRNRVTELLKYVGLHDREDFYVEALSKGMQQKLSLARALINDPDYLIMDEPTSGLDPRTRYEFKQMVSALSDNGKTIVISSHILSDITELCTDIGIIDQGSIVLGGRLDRVMKKLTAGNPIIVIVSSRISEAAAFIRAEKKVSAVSVKGHEIMFYFEGSQDEESALLRRLIEAGLPVRSFSREKGSLESIFMQITGPGNEQTLLSF